ncbi:MAG: OsmC family protein [Deltaproteobacteria bacterium]|nr:OsmC family protein [Deltaproteobacteria bacterium]
MSVEMDLVYEGNLRCKATHGPSGKTLATDAPVDNGGEGSEFSPTDLVAAALGACALTVMGLVARRIGINMDGARVKVIKEMVREPVRRIGAILVRIEMPGGHAYAPEDRRRLEAAANACPVLHSLHPDTRVEMEFAWPATVYGR